MNNKYHKNKIDKHNINKHSREQYSYIFSLVHNSIIGILPTYLIDEIFHKITSNLLNHDISVKKIIKL